jgi:hypothetical protein
MKSKFCATCTSCEQRPSLSSAALRRIVCRACSWRAEAFPERTPDIPFYFFSDRNERSLACGGCISGKNFFRFDNLFSSAHYNPVVLFRFRITSIMLLRTSTHPHPFPGKIKNGSHYRPVFSQNLNQFLKSSIFALFI